MMGLVRVRLIQEVCFIFVSFFCLCGDKLSFAADSPVTSTHVQNTIERGPHGGKMLRDSSFALEVVIFESGVPPHFRVFAYSEGSIVPPSDLSVRIVLTRLGGRVEQFEFAPLGDFLSSSQKVSEPHSFDVEIAAQYKGKSYTWQYASPEAQTVIVRSVADSAGIVVEPAMSHEIAMSHRIRGRIVPSEHRIAHIIPRFSGIVREGRKHIGDLVKQGEVLAVIESNQSLQPFEVRSQISGTVINGHLIVGEFVPENQWVYVVADLSEVWADFYVSLDENLQVRVGQDVLIQAHRDGEVISGKVSYIAPYVDEVSQAQLVRVIIPNAEGELLPGVFITADLIIERRNPPVVVRRAAVQRFRDWEVVFVRYGDVYEARPIVLGHGTQDWVEVIAGLEPGEEYVSQNSFLIKADILKSGATHDH